MYMYRTVPSVDPVCFCRSTAKVLFGIMLAALKFLFPLVLLSRKDSLSMIKSK